MAGDGRSAVNVQGLIKALVGQVRDVENHADLLHGLEESRTFWKEPAFRVGAVGIGTDAIVSRPDDA
jgi:hypothetical protein